MSMTSQHHRGMTHLLEAIPQAPKPTPAPSSGIFAEFRMALSRQVRSVARNKFFLKTRYGGAIVIALVESALYFHAGRRGNSPCLSCSDVQFENSRAFICGQFVAENVLSSCCFCCQQMHHFVCYCCVISL